MVEKESKGTFSAYVAGLPGVYAAADTGREAKRAIREALAAHLDALRERRLPVDPKVELAVLRYESVDDSLTFTGVGSLLGRKTSAAKAQAARRNGRKGGRPRLHAR